jgi:hypothetical protein
MACKHVRERINGEGAREIVDAAVALGLAEDRDDAVGINGPSTNGGLDRRRVIRRSGRKAMDVGAA